MFRYSSKPIQDLIISPFKLSKGAVSFEFINRPEYRVIIPGSKTRSTVSSFILFENEQRMLEELANYGNYFIVDKYARTSYELLDYLIQEPSFLNSISTISEVPLSYSESYVALACQKPYGLQALSTELNSSYEIFEALHIEDKEVSMDSVKLGGATYTFLFKCETTQILTYELEDSEKIFSLDKVLESCAYQLMYVSKECALGCAFCKEGVGYDNT